MTEKEFNVRIRSKHETEYNWSFSPDFVPLDGEMIVYDADESHPYPRIKVGDGVTPLASLPFEGDGKVDKIDGMGLSSNDFTDADRVKLDGIAEGATNYTHPTYRAQTGLPVESQTPAFGDSFTVSQVVSDDTGHITELRSRTVTIPSSTASANAPGLMSVTDKAKLDGIEQGANAYTHPAYEAYTGMPTGSQNPEFGGSFFVGQIVSDSTGHVAEVHRRTVTIPSTLATTTSAGLMSAIDKLKLDSLDSNIGGDAGGGTHIPFVAGTQTGRTGSWTGTAIDLDSVVDGQSIRYWLPFSGIGNATLELTLSDGSTTGAINCYWKGTTRLTTHFAAGSIVMMTYRENVSIDGSALTYTGWWANSDYDSNSDVKVTQTLTDSDAIYPLLLSPSGQTVSSTTSAYFDSGVTLNPSTNTIAASVSGTASNITGVLSISNGGTGATTASAALSNLGAASASHTHNYLPLSGGTVSANATSVLTIERPDSTSYAGLTFKNSNGVLGTIGMNTASGSLYRRDNTASNNYKIHDDQNFVLSLSGTTLTITKT